MTENRRTHGEDGTRIPAGPTDAHRAASRAFANQFERLREETDELLKLQRAAAHMFATHPAPQFDGLCDLLDALLPHERDRQWRIARAVDIELPILQALCASRVDPLEVPPTPMTALSRAMKLDFPTFWALAARDHQRFADGCVAARAKSTPLPESLEAFRAAWERDEDDDPRVASGARP